jgi:hypothetical protein
MKWKNMFIKALVIGLLSVPLSFGENIPSDKSPSAFIPQSDFKFELIAEGEELVHDFTVQNRGNAPLVIEKVQTG